MSDRVDCTEDEFCYKLARAFSRALKKIQSSSWYSEAIPRMVPLPHVIGEKPEDKEMLGKLLALLPDLKLPTGTVLHCSITGDWDFANSSSFYFRFPDGSYQAVESYPVDGSSIKAVWEKMLISWAGSQFYLFWHAGYRAHRIIVNQSDLNRKQMFDKLFLESLDETTRKQFESFDFKPKAILQDGLARIRYYTFSDFGGIRENVAAEPPLKDGGARMVFPYECGVIY